MHFREIPGDGMLHVNDSFEKKKRKTNEIILLQRLQSYVHVVCFAVCYEYEMTYAHPNSLSFVMKV